MHTDRPPAMFVGAATGLDFLNTIASPADEPVEWIASGDDLLAWLQQAGLLAPEEADEAWRIALPGELDAVAAEARALREWFRGFVLARKGQPLATGALAELQPLNRVLARDEAFGAIVPAEPGGQRPLAWRWRRRWRTPGALLLPIAQAMADLVCTADFAQIKGCEGPACTLLFLDTTHRHGRRWCSMAVCGNRAKQATHRRRAHEAHAH